MCAFLASWIGTTGEEGADGDGDGVRQRRAGDPAAHGDPAGGGEERPEKNDEGNVIDQIDVQDLVERLSLEDDQEGDGEDQRPDEADLREVAVPEVRGEERAEGDAEENPGEGDHRPEREALAEGRAVVAAVGVVRLGVVAVLRLVERGGVVVVGFAVLPRGGAGITRGVRIAVGEDRRRCERQKQKEDERRERPADAGAGTPQGSLHAIHFHLYGYEALAPDRTAGSAKARLSHPASGSVKSGLPSPRNDRPGGISRSIEG